MGEIATIRKRRSRDYTTLGNELLRDARLSWKARGLFCYLWSHSDNFRFSIDKLANNAADGRDSTSSGLTELQRLGYLVIERIRGSNGRYIRAIWTLTEDPGAPETATQTPQPENPDVVPHHKRETGIPVKPLCTTEVPLVRTTTTTATAGTQQRSPARIVVVDEVDSGDPADPPRPLSPPQSMDTEDQREAVELVRNLPPDLAQQVLDEIEGGLRARQIENWRGLLYTLITKGFTPNRCKAIEKERQHRAADDLARRQRAAQISGQKPADPELVRKHLDAVAAMLRTRDPT